MYVLLEISYVKVHEAEALVTTWITACHFLMILVWIIFVDAFAEWANMYRRQTSELQKTSGASKALQALHHKIVKIIGIAI